MLRISDRSTPDCVVIQVEGAVSGDEYDLFEDAFEEAADKREHVNLVVEMLGSVRYGDTDAFKDDWEFLTEDYSKVRRAAFVGDQRFINAMMKAFAAFTHAEEKFFASGEIDAAIEWASAAD